MNFPFFNKVVTDEQERHPEWTTTQCEQLALCGLYQEWKSALTDKYGNISLFLYLAKLYKHRPDLKAFAEKSVMWKPACVNREIAFIRGIR